MKWRCNLAVRAVQSFQGGNCLFPAVFRNYSSLRLPAAVRHVLSSMLIGLSSAAVAQDYGYTPANNNVSYAQVEALSFRDSDARISYGEDALQFGRLWLPPQASGPTKATVVLVHGGCWLNAFFMDHTFAFATALSNAGFAVWSLEYRRTGDEGGGWPGTYQDVLRGVNHLTELNQPAVNLETVVLSGHSAGGHLALLAGSQQELLDIELAAVIGLAAITDPAAYARGDNSCETATPQFMKSQPDENPGAYRQANPASHSPHSNTILFQGTADAIVGMEQASLGEAETVIVERAGHFDWVFPGTPAFVSFMNRLERIAQSHAR